MTTQPAQELKKAREIPPKYVSGFSFFYDLKDKNDIANFNGQQLAHIFLIWPEEYSQGRFVYELWRTGNMETVYDFFMLTPTQKGNTFTFVEGSEIPRDQLYEDDVIFNTALMLKVKGVSKDECIAFIYDLACASANAHDDQIFGETPLNPGEVDERVIRMMQEVEDINF